MKFNTNTQDKRRLRSTVLKKEYKIIPYVFLSRPKQNRIKKFIIHKFFKNNLLNYFVKSTRYRLFTRHISYSMVNKSFYVFVLLGRWILGMTLFRSVCVYTINLLSYVRYILILYITYVIHDILESLLSLLQPDISKPLRNNASTLKSTILYTSVSTPFLFYTFEIQYLISESMLSMSLLG